jgi:hypothetical protein
MEMTPLIALPVPLLLEIGIAVGVYALITRKHARRPTPELEREQPAPVKTNAARPGVRTTAISATGV